MESNLNVAVTAKIFTRDARADAEVKLLSFAKVAQERAFPSTVVEEVRLSHFYRFDLRAGQLLAPRPGQEGWNMRGWVPAGLWSQAGLPQPPDEWVDEVAQARSVVEIRTPAWRADPQRRGAICALLELFNDAIFEDEFGNFSRAQDALETLREARPG